MTAYTGGPMQLAGWRYPVVVDLQGLQVGGQRRPILLDHTRDVDFVMGQTDSVGVVNNQLVVAGHVMGEAAKARQVIALNDKGFAWQSSIGARADQVEFVPEGKTSQANGREFAGPVNIARRATLGEISFVVLGADDNRSAQIAASAHSSKEIDMEFVAWIEAQGFTPDALNDSQTKNLRALYDVQAAKPTTPAEPPPNATMHSYLYFGMLAGRSDRRFAAPERETWELAPARLGEGLASTSRIALHTDAACNLASQSQRLALNAEIAVGANCFANYLIHGRITNFRDDAVAAT